MTQDVKAYVEELRAWEREANMKTAMIKKQFILDAFAAVSGRYRSLEYLAGFELTKSTV